MPIAKWPGRVLRYMYGALLALYLTAPAYAFTPAQVPLLSSPIVPANLMLLVDNSGSMYNIIWSSAFDPKIKRTDVSYFSTQCVNAIGVIVLCPFETTISGDDALTLGDINSNGVILGISLNCILGGVPIRRSGITYCLDLPDPAGNGRTRYTANYLSWLIDSVQPTRLSILGIGLVTVHYKDYTNGSIPNDFRMNVAKNVATNLVTNNTSLRIGLAQFNEPNNANPGPGGRVSRAIADLAPVTATIYQPAVTQAQATTNINNLRNSIAALSPTANTPLAETYYEITRYFRGMTSYYPTVQTTYTSPIQYRCQKNYGVVITDGLPTYDRTFPASEPEYSTSSARKLPNWDLVANDGLRPVTSAGSGGDDEGDTLYLDDLAKFAYDIDMRKAENGSDLTRKSWDNTGFNIQNLSTYTIGFTTSSDQMLIDAANDSHGRGKYYQTSDSAGLTAALNLTLGDIYAKAGSGGGGAANSSTLTSSTRVFQTLFDPIDWRGTVRAYNVNATTGVQQTAPAWTTDSQITSTSPGAAFESWRTTGTPRKVILNYANFNGQQKTNFDATLPQGVTGDQLIAWTQGTAHPNLRVRTRLLGDIISSPLVAVLPTDKTSADLTGNTSYATYLTGKASVMNANLLVNTNDGFFNIINPETGVRRYAFMPSTALTSLATIASPTYGSGAHRFTVDGQIAVYDTRIGTSWGTVAYGGTGAGGKAYFAVSLFQGTTNNVGALWEVKAPDTSTPANPFNNLGYAYSRPEVARMADGTGIVVLGNGFGSFTGTASLFVLNAETGVLIREIPIPAPFALPDNGLSSVKLRVNAQNVVQAAYAGDLKGRMWKFDMSSANASAWGVAFNNRPLFTAGGGAAQPITVQPLLLDHPSNNGKLVYFGTGKFLEVADKTTTGQQGFYAIWDADGGTGNISQSALQVQNIAPGSVSGSGASYSTTTSNNVDWETKKGWYLALDTVAPFIGERVIYPAQTTRGRILFTTAAVNSADPCESTGTGRVFQLDAAKGGMLNYQVFDTNGDGRINSSDQSVSGIWIGTGIPSLVAMVAGLEDGNDKLYVVDSSGGLMQELLAPGGKGDDGDNDGGSSGNNVYQRIMWRQIQ